MRTDAEMARALMDAEPGAFDEFVETYRKRLYQYSYLMCGQADDAEEVAQDTLLKVFASLDQLREPERLRAWVFRIAKNACYMKRRKSVFAPAQELSLEELMPSVKENGGVRQIQIADWSPLPDERAWRSQLRGILRGGIAALPETSRVVLLLRDVEGLSTAEAAEVLDVSEDVVKTRLHRARLAVRKHIDEYLGSRTAKED